MNRFAVLAFWAFALLTLVSAQNFQLSGIPVLRVVLWSVLVLSLFLVSVVDARSWKNSGAPFQLMLFTLALHAIVGTIVSLASDAEIDLRRELVRQFFFIVLFLAAALGGRAALQLIGTEALLKGILALLSTSCVIVLASPVLHDLDALRAFPRNYESFRLTGGFSDPNDAGFVGCATVVLSLAFLDNTRRRAAGYAGLGVGIAAVVASASGTAALVLVLILARFASRVFETAAHTTRESSLDFVLSKGRLSARAIVFFSLFACAAGVIGKDMLSESLKMIERKISVGIEVIFDETTDKKGGMRLVLWRMGADKVLERPLFGHGLGRLRSMDDAPVEVHGRPVGVHNMYLLLIGEAGVVPLALYILFLVSLIRLRWTAPRSLTGDTVVGWAIVAVLFGVMFQHLFVSGFFLFLVGLSCALAAHPASQPFADPCSRRRPGPLP